MYNQSKSTIFLALIFFCFSAELRAGWPFWPFTGLVKWIHAKRLEPAKANLHEMARNSIIEHYPEINLKKIVRYSEIDETGAKPAQLKQFNEAQQQYKDKDYTLTEIQKQIQRENREDVLKLLNKQKQLGTRNISLQGPVLANTQWFVTPNDLDIDPVYNQPQIKITTMGGEEHFSNSFNTIDLYHEAYCNINHEKHMHARELIESLQALNNMEQNKDKLNKHYTKSKYDKSFYSVQKEYQQSVSSSLANINDKN